MGVRKVAWGSYFEDINGRHDDNVHVNGPGETNATRSPTPPRRKARHKQGRGQQQSNKRAVQTDPSAQLRKELARMAELQREVARLRRENSQQRVEIAALKSQVGGLRQRGQRLEREKLELDAKLNRGRATQTNTASGASRRRKKRISSDPQIGSSVPRQKRTA